MPFEGVQIVIPSSGRPNKQTTWQQLPQWAKDKTLVAVPARETAAYAKAFPGKLLAVPDECRGISATRKHLMDWCRLPYLLMIDDDMTFAYRPDMDKPQLRSLPPEDLEIGRMLGKWRTLMKRYAHAGLSARQGNNRISTELQECCRMYNTYMYDLDAVRRAGVQVGRLPVMEDFDLTLQLLRAGLPNAVMYRWCWNQGGSNAPGGCSQYRTGEMQAEAAAKLAELHPGFVRVVEKRSTNWQGMNTRKDVTVYWKKAYESAQK